MNNTERLSETELPVDPEQFCERLTAEVDAFIDEHGIGEPRFQENALVAEIVGES